MSNSKPCLNVSHEVKAINGTRGRDGHFIRVKHDREWNEIRVVLTDGTTKRAEAFIDLGHTSESKADAMVEMRGTVTQFAEAAILPDGENTTASKGAMIRAAKRLNDHHLKTCAGFYPSAGCARAFGARVRGDALEITPDFGNTWLVVNFATIKFHDHNGRPICL